jgi:hypothetical protein
VQATKLLALLLAIVLSPRIATADVVRPMDHSGVESVASENATVEPGQVASEAGAPAPATVASDDSDEDQSGPAWARPSVSAAKKRWGSLRRLPLLRRPAAPVIGCLGCDGDGAQPLSTSRFSNSSGVSGLANR